MRYTGNVSPRPSVTHAPARCGRRLGGAFGSIYGCLGTERWAWSTIHRPSRSTNTMDSANGVTMVRPSARTAVAVQTPIHNAVVGESSVMLCRVWV